MARIWQEGFEGGLHQSQYLEGSPFSQHINGLSIAYGMYGFCDLVSGRTGQSQYALRLRSSYYNTTPLTRDNYMIKTLESSYSELYCRFYFKYDNSFVNGATNYPLFQLLDTSSNVLFEIENNTTISQITFDINVRKGGSLTNVATKLTAQNTWYKVDVYFKCNASTGAYEIKFDDVSVISESSIDTGSNNIKNIKFQAVIGPNVLGSYNSTMFDDIAVNDTSGSLNNSWCGSGTILALKPSGAGNYSQWDTCSGIAYGESGTNTTTIKITGHGLASNDVIYNKTQGQYRIVTVSDANTLTVSTVTGQTTNDEFLMYNFQSTIGNTIAVTAFDDEYCTLVGHNLQSGDVIINTTRSNAIRPVIFVNGNDVYIHYDSVVASPESGDFGQNISTMANGDSIKTFKFKPYTMTNHYQALIDSAPSPQTSYVKTGTLNDIDTYDMEELTADKGLPSTAGIVAVSHNIYAREAGGGSEYQPLFRISSTDYAGSTVSLSAGTLQYNQIHETSPATSSAWTRAEIDGLEAGVKLV